MSTFVPVYDPECDGEAFKISSGVSVGDLVSAEDFRLPDGRKPNPYDELICNACGRSLTFENLPYAELVRAADGAEKIWLRNDPPVR